MCKLKGVDFVVWFGTGRPLFVETIWYDEEFMVNYVFPRLKYFFVEQFSLSFSQSVLNRDLNCICMVAGRILMKSIFYEVIIYLKYEVIDQYV